ncbi:histidine phosphatase family protein [Paenibacillus sp. NAIST15-1]|uniref:histidine phosphatase family protein n=1 Tax=Paenibacillus sp. NAIST15-1 TaxID=1605994 RepID=UPI00086DB642|nr:histidine phosphatase family protein [Paenibacillus sp. NAIST15-1]GAV11787.1 phosphoglycerate mutase [Paenibacillus sp. NAIST15-1]
MKIGLVRHFPVQCKPEKKWMSSADFNHWVEQYDQAEVILADPPNDTTVWDLCVSSDLSRAVTTAEHIYTGRIITTHRLREIGMRSVFQSNVKLLHIVWMILSRLAWLCSHSSQEETKQQTLSRVKEVIDWIEAENQSNVLVICHGALMKVVHKELVRRDYKGKAEWKPQNGKLYVYVKG